MDELNSLIASLAHPGLFNEVAALAACLVVAFGLCWLGGRQRSEESVWFGRFIIDGLLFPVLALTLAYVAQQALARHQSVALLKVVVPILVSLVVIRFLARVFTVVFPTSGWARLVERLVSWLAWMGAILWVAGLLPVFIEEMESIRFAFGKTRISLLNLIEGGLSAGAVLVVTLWISAVLERRVLRHAVHDLSLRKVAGNMIRAGLLLVGMLLALSLVGVDLTALSVLGGALGVGLGFGLQKLAANYVSGFVILFERSLRIGDTVRVDNFEGQILDIKTRYTLIRAGNGRESIVPNEKLITERIENLYPTDPRILQQTDIAVGYDSDADQVRKILCDAARGVPHVLSEPAPVARLMQFGADGLEFSLLYWVGDPSVGPLNVRSEVNLAVLRGLREASVEIPFPQRVVQFRGAEPSLVTKGNP